MFRVNNNQLLANDLDILYKLKNDLQERGIEKLKDIHEGNSNIQITCPIHNNGQEKKPSCGISTIDKGTIKAGTCHCFACGYIASLEEMISHCFGYDDFGNYGREWLIKNFLSVSVDERPDIKLDFLREVVKTESNYISDEYLDIFRYYHDYMFERKLNKQVIERFDVGFDPNFRLNLKNGKLGNKIPCITFPVKDIHGNVVFIARRAINFKMFHYPEDVLKPVYGLYELPTGTKEVIVCESIINALTCYVYGKVGIALLGLGTDYQYNILRKSGIRKFITAFDGDSAGKTATQRFKQALGNQFLVTSYKIPKGKDINDLTKSEFDNLIEVF